MYLHFYKGSHMFVLTFIILQLLWSIGKKKDLAFFSFSDVTYNNLSIMDLRRGQYIIYGPSKVILTKDEVRGQYYQTGPY